MTTSTINGQTNTYAYDVRNKMTGATVNGVTSSDVHDDAGNRVAETVNGVATFYLTDNNNPTGYAQPIEERSTPSGPPGITYLIGDHVFGQAKANAGVTYFVTDGHGSTAAVTSSAAAVTSALTYDAFGTALNFSANTPPTIFLFGGDAVWAPATSLYLNGDGTRGRDGTAFVESDSQGYANNTEPTTLHKYLYAGADPVDNWDPSGHDFDLISTELTTAISNTVDVVSDAYSVYRRVNTLIKAVNNIDTFLELANGGFSAILNEVQQNLISLPKVFGQAASRFTLSGFKQGAEDLIANSAYLIEQVLAHPGKLAALGGALEGPNPGFMILLPTPPGKNLFYEIPPIKTGLKFGSSQIPVYVAFGSISQSVRFVGLSIASDVTNRRFDTSKDTINVFHMDYVIHDSHPNDWASWPTTDGLYEFQIPKDQ